MVPGRKTSLVTLVLILAGCAETGGPNTVTRMDSGQPSGTFFPLSNAEDDAEEPSFSSRSAVSLI